MKEVKFPKIYDSKWGAKGGKVHAGQILAEIMCERMARKDNVQLNERFWHEDRWKKIYMMQLRFACSLLQIYEPSIISTVLKTGIGRKAYSLGAPWLDALFAGEKASREQKQKIAEMREQERTSGHDRTQPDNNDALPARPEFAEKPKNNILSKLKDL